MPANVALTNGSQNAFFMLFNALGGFTSSDTGQGDIYRQILLPMAPEYIGYTDVGVDPRVDSLFTAKRPEIELLDDQQFKYR